MCDSTLNWVPSDGNLFGWSLTSDNTFNSLFKMSQLHFGHKVPGSNQSCFIAHIGNISSCNQHSITTWMLNTVGRSMGEFHGIKWNVQWISEIKYNCPAQALLSKNSLFGTDVCRQISEHIFAPNGDHCLFLKCVHLHWNPELPPLQYCPTRKTEPKQQFATPYDREKGKGGHKLARKASFPSIAA